MVLHRLILRRLALLLALPLPRLPVDPESAPPPLEPMVYAVRAPADLAAVLSRLDALDRLGVTRIALDPALVEPAGSVLAIAAAASQHRVGLTFERLPAAGRTPPSLRVLSFLAPGQVVLQPADVVDPLVVALAALRRQLGPEWRCHACRPPVFIFERFSRGRRLVVTLNLGPAAATLPPATLSPASRTTPGIETDALTGERTRAPGALPGWGYRLTWVE